VRRAAWLFGLLFPLAAHGDVVHTVDHARILVKDVIVKAPEGIADVDLGPAPPPGGSRLVMRDEILTHLRERGVDVTRLVIPASVRVVGAARRISPNELALLVTPAIEEKLAAGVTLTKAQPTYEVVVPPRTVVRSVELPRTPRQKGSFRTTATVELASDGEVVAKVPVPVVLEVSEDAARPDAPRGSKIGLVIDRRSIRITTQGSLMNDANVGDTVGAMVVATGRVVKVRLVARDEAEVLEAP
jgi:Chaperone for flagella basal body P-ring formation